VSRPSHFPDRMPRLGTAAGALVTMPTGSAALTLMAIAVVVAVSVVSLVVLVAVLGRGARHRAALTVLSVLLGGRIRSGTDQMTAHAGHPAAVPRAVHRSIVVVDVEGFSDARRTNPNQVAIRNGLYRAMRAAFDHTGIPWADCGHEDRGDGVFVLIPAEVPKGLLVELLPSALVRALHRHNSTHQDQERIRLRMALHAGEVSYDSHGATATAVNLAFRLLDASALKAALAASSGVLAVIASSWFFHEVVRHSPACDAAEYRPVRAAVKETSAIGWIHLPDQIHSPGRAILDKPLSDTHDHHVGTLRGAQVNSGTPGN
jgi:hypothetical protein